MRTLATKLIHIVSIRDEAPCWFPFLSFKVSKVINHISWLVAPDLKPGHQNGNEEWGRSGGVHG